MANVILLEEPGILKVSYEATSRLQIHEWLDYNPENRDPLILELLERIFQLFMEYPVEKVLVVADRARGAFSPQVQDFVRDVQFPRFVSETQIRYVATVKSTEFLQSIGIEVWRGQLKKMDPIIIQDFASEAEARQWLQSSACRVERD